MPSNSVGQHPQRISLMLALLIFLGRMPCVGQTTQTHRNDEASLQSFQIPSHGVLLNAFMYVAAGGTRHPVVVLLHGFPGNERNLDLAQNIRKSGWDVLYFDYRGSWGSPGSFSFTHGIEDTAAAVAYVKTPQVESQLRVDTAQIVLLGHSVGGFMAVEEGAADPSVVAIGMISAADLGGRITQPFPKQQETTAMAALSLGYASEGMAPLAGCTSAGLAKETLRNASEWRFESKTGDLKARPMLIVTSDDGLAASNDRFAQALRSRGNEQVTTLHLATDHSYSDKRGELSAEIVRWLGTLAQSR